MTDYDADAIGDGLLRLAGLALVVVGLNASLSFFDVVNFLAKTPEAFQMFTYLGAGVGAVDNTFWSLTKKGLSEIADSM